jgi:hypothetical protein
VYLALVRQTERALANNSYRFKVTQAQLQLLGRGREFFLPPLAPRYIQDLCRRTQVDGLVVLEAFDSDMAMSHTNGTRTVKDKEGKEYQVPTVHVEMVMKVVTGFRTYSATQGFVLDQARQEDQFVLPVAPITTATPCASCPRPRSAFAG